MTFTLFSSKDHLETGASLDCFHADVRWLRHGIRPFDAPPQFACPNS